VRVKYLDALFSLLGMVFRAIAFGWIGRLIEAFRELLARMRRKRRMRRLPRRIRRSTPEPCVTVSDPAFKRPDPLIYAQFHLMKQGLAVTWDNPDIELRRNGAPVPSHGLALDTEYDVVARIWNNSTEAPVAGLPVRFSYLSFGVGTQSHFIGQTHVNLGVKGGPNHPAFATVPWRTPAQAGHYCLRVSFSWVDDVNPNNNLGQENTDVGKAASPATFTFQLRNDTRSIQRYRFETDAYRIPPLGPCRPRPPGPVALPREEPGTIAVIPAAHDRANHPLPPGWTVALEPAAPTLPPGDEITVRAVVTPPDAFTGRQPVNVHAFHQYGLAGGVTLVVERP
jgi:hypothetical protein